MEIRPAEAVSVSKGPSHSTQSIQRAGGAAMPFLYISRLPRNVSALRLLFSRRENFLGPSRVNSTVVSKTWGSIVVPVTWKVSNKLNPSPPTFLDPAWLTDPRTAKWRSGDVPSMEPIRTRRRYLPSGKGLDFLGAPRGSILISINSSLFRFPFRSNTPSKDPVLVSGSLR